MKQLYEIPNLNWIETEKGDYLSSNGILTYNIYKSETDDTYSVYQGFDVVFQRLESVRKAQVFCNLHYTQFLQNYLILASVGA